MGQPKGQNVDDCSPVHMPSSLRTLQTCQDAFRNQSHMVQGCSMAFAAYMLLSICPCLFLSDYAAYPFFFSLTRHATFSCCMQPTMHTTCVGPIPLMQACLISCHMLNHRDMKLARALAQLLAKHAHWRTAMLLISSCTMSLPSTQSPSQACPAFGRCNR